MVFVATVEGRLCALDPRSGAIVAEEQLPGPLFSSPVVLPSESGEASVLIGCRDDKLYCYSMAIDGSMD